MDALVRHDHTYAFLISPNYDRKQPIVVHATNGVLLQMLALRSVVVEQDVERALQARVEELTTTCREQQLEIKRLTHVGQSHVDTQALLTKEHTTRHERLMGDLATLKRDVQAKTNLHEDAERRLRELQVEFARRGDRLAATEQSLASEKQAMEGLKRRWERMAVTIRAVLAAKPDRGADSWCIVHEPLRSTLLRAGYHTHVQHPWWSIDRWFGCPRCVPAVLLAPPAQCSVAHQELMDDVLDQIQERFGRALKPAMNAWTVEDPKVTAKK